MIKLPTERENQSKISSRWSKCVFFWVTSNFGFWIYQVMMGRYWLLIEGVGGTEWKSRDPCFGRASENAGARFVW
jgi:hypothetical protein